jgi:hypothetical protein
MTKFVLAVLAGIVATVVGGLTLNYISSLQQTPSPVTVPTSATPVDLPDLTPPQPYNPYKDGYLSRGEAEQNCDKRAFIYKFEHGPYAGRYFCF